jgi:LPXTG-motif cell wall-anchored protein
VKHAKSGKLTIAILCLALTVAFLTSTVAAIDAPTAGHRDLDWSDLAFTEADHDGFWEDPVVLDYNRETQTTAYIPEYKTVQTGSGIILVAGGVPAASANVYGTGNMNAIILPVAENLGPFQPGNTWVFTMKITNTLATRVSFGLATAQYEGDYRIDDSTTIPFRIPLDDGEELKNDAGIVIATGPRDDRGHVGAAVIPPVEEDGTRGTIWGNVAGETTNSYDIGDDPYGLYDTYLVKPANLFDKIRVRTYTSTSPNTFRHEVDSDNDSIIDSIEARTAAELATAHVAPKSDYFMAKNGADPLQVQLLTNESVYVHYVFYWYGRGNNSERIGNAAPNLYSPVADITGNSAGLAALKEWTSPADDRSPTVPTTMNPDNFYQGARMAVTWRYTAAGDVVAPSIEPPSNPPFSSPTPEETEPPPTIPLEPPETPEVTESPTDDPPESPGEIETIQPTGGPGDMPFTGGFSLGNLFFVGLLLLAIGLIFILSRRREEEDPPAEK